MNTALVGLVCSAVTLVIKAIIDFVHRQVQEGSRDSRSSG